MTNHWDEFSKSLAEPFPRRESLRRLGVVVAGAVLSPLGLETAFAGRQSSDPCKSFCRCRRKSDQNQCLAACRACQGAGRLCGACGDYYCADLEGDFYNCGACGHVCGPLEPGEDGACIFGECWYQCVEGAVYCDGTCTFLNDDRYNCGACGYACEDPDSIDIGVACVSGTCEYTVCGPWIDYNWDSSNCGRCGNVCPPGAGCAFGICGTPGGGDGGF